MDDSTQAADLDARTPADRDRVVDLVRAVSIVVVVLGHWTMAALVRDGDALRLRNVLEVATWAHPLTWVLQVMPLFFLAAGFTNHLSLSPRADGRTRSRATYLSGRVDRVLRPTLLLVAIWIPLAAVVVALGAPGKAIDAAGTAAAMPLWFLAVYLLLALLAPAQLAVHRRSPALLLVVLPIGTALLDRLQGTSWAGLAFLSYALVFGFCQELGFWYAEGRLQRVSRTAWVGVALGAVALLVVVTRWGGYPVSMIGLPGQQVSNMMPPSVCVVLVAVLQTALLMLVRPALSRWLARPRVWMTTIAVNVRVMTLFLWHLTGFVLIAGVMLGTGTPLPAVASAAWWGWKLVWLALAAVVTTGLVLGLGGLEQRPARVVALPSPVVVLGGITAALGLTMVACSGFTDPFTAGGIELLGLQFIPAVGAVLVLLGWLLVGGRPPASGGS